MRKNLEHWQKQPQSGDTMKLFRELQPSETPNDETDFFVKGVRPSPSVRMILRPIGEWDKFDLERMEEAESEE
jgi:hypothetical protein